MFNSTISGAFTNNNIGYMIDSEIGDTCQHNNFEHLDDVIINDNCSYLSTEGLISALDLTGVTELYGKTYPHKLIRKPDDSYQYSYVDDFGDTLIDDIV